MSPRTAAASGPVSDEGAPALAEAPTSQPGYWMRTALSVLAPLASVRTLVWPSAPVGHAPVPPVVSLNARTSTVVGAATATNIWMGAVASAHSGAVLPLMS